VKAKQPELLEQRRAKDEIDLLYGDETQISGEGYVCLMDGNLRMKACAYNRLSVRTSTVLVCSQKTIASCIRQQNITSDFIIEQLDRLSFEIIKHTVVVLDNAKVHQNKKLKGMRRIGAKRKLFIFFLPPYSPHLNIIERLWKEVKTRWLRPEDYTTTDQLFYAVNRILHAIGKPLFINFKLSPTNET
jgi:transposase